MELRGGWCCAGAMRPGTLAPAAGVQFGGEEVAADLRELCASFCSIEHCDQAPIGFASAVGTRLLVCKLERRSESHREAATNGCPRNSHTHLTQIAFEAEEIQSLCSTSPQFYRRAIRPPHYTQLSVARAA